MGRKRSDGVNPSLIRPRVRLERRDARAGWKYAPAAPIVRGLRIVSDLRAPTEFPRLEADLSESAAPPIVIYTTAVCPYCVAAKNFLRSKGRTWTEVRVDLEPDERTRMVARTRRTSVPQIFVGEIHIGGYDDMIALHRAGGLDPLLDGGAR